MMLHCLPGATVAAEFALEAFINGLTLVWKDLWCGMPQESPFALRSSAFLRMTQVKTERHTFPYKLNHWPRLEEQIMHRMVRNSLTCPNSGWKPQEPLQSVRFCILAFSQIFR